MIKQIKKKYPLMEISVFFIITLIFSLTNSYNANLIQILDDEFGYWGNAALLIGYDWNDLMKQTVFYSLGYSIILVPLLKTISNVFILYRIAIAINSILYFNQLVLAYLLAKELFSLEGKGRFLSVIISVAGIAPLFYIGFTGTETLLTTLYLLAIYLLNRIEKYGIYTCTYPLAVVLAWMQLVHRRALPVVLLIVFFLCLLFFKNKHYLSILITCCVIGIFFKLYSYIISFQKNNFFNEAMLSWNDSVSSTGSMAKNYASMIMNDYEAIIESTICKLGMASISTYGTLLFIFLVFVVSIKNNRDDLNDEISLTKICVILCALAMIFLEAIQLCDSTYRKDFATYTRYFDYVLPPITLYGYSILAKNVGKFKKEYFASLFITLCTIPCMYYATIKSAESYNAFCNPILGAFYQIVFYKIGNYNDDKLVFTLLAKAFILLILLSIICVSTRKKIAVLIMGIVICSVLFLNGIAGDWGKDRRKAVNEHAIHIYNLIKNDNYDIYCIKCDEEIRYQKYIQFLLRNRKIVVVSSIDEIDENEPGWILTQNNYDHKYALIYESWFLNLYSIDR